MVRPTDQEAVAIGKIVCYSQFPRGGAQIPHGPHGETPELVRRQKENEDHMDKRLHSPSGVRDR